MTLQSFLAAPSAGLLGMLGYFLLFLIVLLLLFLGAAGVLEAVTLARQRFGNGTADHTDHSLVARTTPWIAMGVLPALILPVVLGMILYEAGAPLELFAGLLLTGLLLSMILVKVHHRFRLSAAGALGLLMLLVSGLALSLLLSLAMAPEQWPIVHPRMPILFSITPLVEFLILLSSSCLVGGSLLLISDPVFPAHSGEPSRRRFAGPGLILAGALTLPPLLLWDHHTAMGPTLSLAVFWMSALTIIASFILSLWSARELKRPGSGTTRTAVAASLIAVLLVGGRITTQIMNANREHGRWLTMQAEDRTDETLARRQQEYQLSEVRIAEAGEAIFNQRCTSCHAFDRKVLGPPYNEVLDKYVDDPAALRTFLANPEKIDPAYPPMPDPGLKSWEVEAVSSYLLEQYDVRR